MRQLEDEVQEAEQAYYELNMQLTTAESSLVSPIYLCLCHFMFIIFCNNNYTILYWYNLRKQAFKAAWFQSYNIYVYIKKKKKQKLCFKSKRNYECNMNMLLRASASPVGCQVSFNGPSGKPGAFDAKKGRVIPRTRRMECSDGKRLGRDDHTLEIQS